MSMPCEPEALWDLFTTVGRIGEFSPERADVRWVEGFPAHAVGGRSEGRNRGQADGDTFKWMALRRGGLPPPHRFAYTVGDRLDGTPATRWTLEIARRSPGASWNSGSSTSRMGTAVPASRQSRTPMLRP